MSLALTLMQWSTGDLRARGVGLALAWFLIAAYCQFFGGSAILTAAGLALQTLLAIGLIVRWRLEP